MMAGLRAHAGRAAIRGLVALALAAPAGAGILGGAPQVGAAEPWPVHRARLLDGVDVMVAITRAADGGIVDTVSRPEPLRIEAGIVVGSGVADQALRLHCQVQRVDPKGAVSAVLWQGACFDGRTVDVTKAGALLAADYGFVPETSDLNGTAGVAFSVRDEVSGQETMVLTTYRWTGGAE